MPSTITKPESAWEALESIPKKSLGKINLVLSVDDASISIPAEFTESEGSIYASIPGLYMSPGSQDSDVENAKAKGIMRLVIDLILTIQKYQELRSDYLSTVAPFKSQKQQYMKFAERAALIFPAKQDGKIARYDEQFHRIANGWFEYSLVESGHVADIADVQDETKKKVEGDRERRSSSGRVLLYKNSSGGYVVAIDKAAA